MSIFVVVYDGDYCNYNDNDDIICYNSAMMVMFIVSYRIVSYRIVSYRIVSYRIVSYRIVSYRIVLYCIYSGSNWCRRPSNKTEPNTYKL